jgi:hypothetical protein
MEQLQQQWEDLQAYQQIISTSPTSHLKGINHHWSKTLINIITNERHEQCQQSWVTAYNKLIRKKQAHAARLRMQGKYKESNREMKNIVKFINGENINHHPQQIPPIELRVADPFPRIIARPQTVANRFADHLEQFFNTMLQSQQQQDATIIDHQNTIRDPNSTPEETQRAHTELQQLQDNIEPSQSNAATLNYRITPREIAKAISKLKRFKSLGSDMLPIELLLTCCETNNYKKHDIYGDDKNSIIKSKIQRRSYQMNKTKHLFNRPPQLEQKFMSKLHHPPNSMLIAVTKLFNMIYSTSITPRIWNVSYITMLPKDPTDLHNINKYRPISVGANLQKIFNKVLCDRLQEHALWAKLISQSQAAYQKQRERHENLIILIENAQQAIKQNIELWTLYIDISKAFDAIPHRKLIKLLHFKLPNANIFISYIHNLYSNLCFTIKINNRFSDIKRQVSGIKQGCVISPLLFILYFNEITKFTTNLSLEYADDLTVQEYSQQLLQHQANIIGQQCKRYNLNINYEKCDLQVFKDSPSLTPLTIQINGNTIQESENVKYLGLTINNQLKIDQMFPKFKDTKIIYMSKTLSSTIIPTSVKQQIINEQIYAKSFHNAPVLGLLLQSNQDNFDYFQDHIINPLNNLLLIAAKINNARANPNPIMAYSTLQITPPKAFVLTQTMRFLHKYTYNSEINPLLYKIITRSHINPNTSLINNFITKSHQTMLNVPIFEKKMNELEHHNVSFDFPLEKFRRPYILNSTFEKILFSHRFIKSPINPNVFPFKPKSDHLSDFVPELYKHCIILQDIMIYRQLTFNRTNNKLHQYFVTYNVENKQILTFLSSTIVQLNRGINLINNLMTDIPVHHKFHTGTRRLLRKRCHWCQRTLYNEYHVLIECSHAKAKRREILEEAKYIIRKYGWENQYSQEESKYRSLPFQSSIIQMQQKLLSDPDFQPIQQLILDPFSTQSKQLLSNNDINPESILSCWWDHDITTHYVSRGYHPLNNCPIRILVYSEQYQQLLHHQRLLSMWKPTYIKFPTTMEDLEVLFDHIMDGAEQKHFYKLFALENIPSIVKTFVYIYLAIAAPALL